MFSVTESAEVIKSVTEPVEVTELVEVTEPAEVISKVGQNDIVQLRLGIIGKRLICFQTRSLVS